MSRFYFWIKERDTFFAMRRLKIKVCYVDGM